MHRVQPLVISIAWSVCVCVLDTCVSPAKTDELIENSRCSLRSVLGWAKGTMY